MKQSTWRAYINTLLTELFCESDETAAALGTVRIQVSGRALLHRKTAAFIAPTLTFVVYKVMSDD